VIRGVPDGHPSATKISIFWPSWTTCNDGVDHEQKQVLVGYGISGRYAIDPSGGIPGVPYAWGPPGAMGVDCTSVETSEPIDGVSFQGGDVQVLFGFTSELGIPLAGTISNCVFDMRHGFQVEPHNGQAQFVEGPWMGLMMQKTWMDEVNTPPPFDVVGHGYLDQWVHLVGNTFVLAEFRQGDGGWSFAAKEGGVAVIDVARPFCPGQGGDPNPLFRGVGHPGIQNNLLRTFTGGAGKNGSTMALVGINVEDALVSSGGIGTDTNAYAVNRSGGWTSISGVTQFISIPVASSAPLGNHVDYGCGQFGFLELLWDGSSPAPEPGAPAAPMWGGRWHGYPSARAPLGFEITCRGLRNQSFGRLFLTQAGKAPPGSLFGGGTMCLEGPLFALPSGSAGGSDAPTLDCSGTFSADLNDWFFQRSPAWAGETINVQYWARDPGSLDVGQHSDAIPVHVHALTKVVSL
jgi:hypothetical protein